MASPILIIGGAVALLYFMTSKKKSTESTPANVLPATTTPTGSTQVTVPVPGSAGQQATVTVQPPTITLPEGTPITNPMVDGTGWTLADDGSNSLAIKSPTGDVYHVTRAQVITAVSGATVVAIRPDLQVVNPAIIHVATEATPPGVVPTTTATTTATATLPALATQVAQAVQVLSNQAGSVLTPPIAVQTTEVSPSIDTNGTVALAAKMINAESSKGWKTALSSDIKSWQSRKGLTADGKFGPKSALAMATEVGILPLIRYWASTGGSQSQQLAAFRTALGALASSFYAKNPAQSIALRSSQDYEQGQGYSTAPAAVSATKRVEQAAALNTALKG